MLGTGPKLSTRATQSPTGLPALPISTQPSLKQINNFLKLCFAIDFATPGLFRLNPNTKVLNYCQNYILPILDNFILLSKDLKHLQLLADETIDSGALIEGPSQFSPKMLATKFSRRSSKTKNLMLEGKSKSMHHFIVQDAPYELRNTGFQLLQLNDAFSKLRGASLDADESKIAVSLIAMAKQLLNNNKIFQESSVGLGIQKHLIALFRDYDRWLSYEDVKFVDSDKSPIVIKDSSFVLKTLRLQIGIITYLVKQERIDMAELIHNALHLCHLTASHNKKNTPFILGKMMAMPLLVKPFKLMETTSQGQFNPKKLVTYCASFIELAIAHKQFSQPFSDELPKYLKAIQESSPRSSDLSPRDSHSPRKLSKKGQLSRQGSVGQYIKNHFMRSTSVDGATSEKQKRSSSSSDDALYLELSVLLNKAKLNDFTSIEEDDPTLHLGLNRNKAGTPRIGEALRKDKEKDQLPFRGKKHNKENHQGKEAKTKSTKDIIRR